MRPFKPVAKKDFLENCQETLASCMEILQAKNDDYSTRDIQGDALRNFRIIEQLGISPAEHGVLIRLVDKITQISNFMQSGILSVQNKKIDDTIQDTINYLLILKETIKSYKKE